MSKTLPFLLNPPLCLRRNGVHGRTAVSGSFAGGVNQNSGAKLDELSLYVDDAS
jgi:hypothetical protein